MSTTTSAGTKTQLVFRVYIKASRQAVWDAITKREWTERYGYGGGPEEELSKTGPYRILTSKEMKSAGAQHGFTVPEVAIDGEVLEIDPPHKLVTTWRMLMDDNLAAEGFTQLTYELDERPGGITRLTVVHELENAPQLALLLAGEAEDSGAGGGWYWVLSSLKTLLETGTSLVHGA